MKNEDKGCFSALGVLIFAIAMIVVGALMNGWVVTILWEWFIVPVLGLPSLALVPAIGFALTVGVLTKNTNLQTNKDKTTMETASELFALAVIQPLFTLFMGWIIQSFM